MSGAAMDLGLGAKAAQEAKDEQERLKQKKQLDQRTGQNQIVSPYSAAFLSLTGNQF